MIQINKKTALFFIGFCFTTSAIAQQFKYKAALDTVTKTGFYQLNVSANLSAHIKTDFSDLRITDEKGKWVPHLIKHVLPNLMPSAFKEFPILTNEITDSGKTKLIIENKGSSLVVNNVPVKNINELVLFIKNASVSRYAAISGSNDQQRWFIIGENILLTKNYEIKENYFISSIAIGNSDYKYFKLVIDNEKADPLNIIKAGSYADLTYYAQNYFTGNPDAVLNQTDSSDGKSYIKIKNNAAYHIDRITIKASGAKFFDRNANIYLPENDSTENTINYNTILSIKISSSGSNTFDLKKLKAKTFYVIIDNKDNPPLKINSISTEQQSNTIITYLEKDKSYYLFADDETAVKPDYDLEHFKDSIPPNIDITGFGPFIKVEAVKTAEQKSSSNKWWLWPSIIGAILILAFLSWKLLGDMKKSES
jgi:hypothetical protein